MFLIYKILLLFESPSKNPLKLIIIMDVIIVKVMQITSIQTIPLTKYKKEVIS